jgi:hypothetical protein
VDDSEAGEGGAVSGVGCPRRGRPGREKRGKWIWWRPVSGAPFAELLGWAPTGSALIEDLDAGACSARTPADARRVRGLQAVSTVLRLARRADAPAPLLPRQVDTAIHLDNLGWSLARVGEHLGVDPTTVPNQPSETSRPDPRHPRPTSVLTRWRSAGAPSNDGASTDPPRDGYADVSWQGAFRSPWCG